MGKKSGSGTSQNISRRQFINGVACGVGATALNYSSPGFALNNNAATNYYPPKLTGLRGSHPGAFEVAHSVAWQGKQWPIPSALTDDPYDLIVVGGGISGLSAALLFQQKAGPDARILILENHDDFGGHAKRNEFTVEGKKLLGSGGSRSIADPGSYSKEAKQLLKDISIETDRFYQYYDQDFVKKHKLKHGILFDEASYGKNILADNFFETYNAQPEKLAKVIATYPIAKQSQQSLLDFLQHKNVSIPKEWSYQEKIEKLRKTSFYDFLKSYTKLNDEAISVFFDTPKSYYGVSWDSLSTLDAIRVGVPGTDKLGIKYKDISKKDDYEPEPYIFHFPDGNAGITRGLVRKLIPGCMPGSTMEDLVLSKLDYSQLDQSKNRVRLRLNSTAVNVQHSHGKNTVDVTYVKNNQSYKVQGKHCILACYNNIIPHICPEVSEQQKEAIAYATKVPLVLTNIAIRNWRAFADSGYHEIHVPKQTHSHRIMLDFPVSMGGYDFANTPDLPTVIHTQMVPNKPHQGLSARDQYRYGRHKLYQTSFAEYEQHLFRQLDAALSPYGFDPVKDITAITVNRWSHGYSYEYNELFDPVGWSPGNGPHIAGRQQIGNISIANADSHGLAMVESAIDAAVRAVNEQLNGT